MRYLAVNLKCCYDGFFCLAGKESNLSKELNWRTVSMLNRLDSYNSLDEAWSFYGFRGGKQFPFDSGSRNPPVVFTDGALSLSWHKKPSDEWKMQIPSRKFLSHLCRLRYQVPSTPTMLLECSSTHACCEMVRQRQRNSQQLKHWSSDAFGKLVNTAKLSVSKVQMDEKPKQLRIK